MQLMDLKCSINVITYFLSKSFPKAFDNQGSCKYELTILEIGMKTPISFEHLHVIGNT